MTTYQHMILTTISAFLEEAVRRHAPSLRVCQLKGFYTGGRGSDKVYENEIGSRQIDTVESMLFKWKADAWNDTVPFLALIDKIRTEFMVPTISILKLGLIYRFNGDQHDPPIIKEFFGVDSTKHGIYMTRRNPDGECRYPNDWIYQMKREWNKELNEKCTIPDEVRIRLRDTFLVTEKTEPNVMQDRTIMDSLTCRGVASLVQRKADQYILCGVHEP